MTKRLAVFASYDRNGIVHDFVVNYLKKLRAVADTVVFVADNTADEKERAKLNGLWQTSPFLNRTGNTISDRINAGSIWRGKRGCRTDATSCFCATTVASPSREWNRLLPT